MSLTNASLNPSRPQLVRDNLMTLQSHILAEETRYPGASGDFSWIMAAISTAGKAIGNKVRRARIEDVIGAHGEANVHGEQQQKLDVIANEIILRCLGEQANVAVVASEEDESPSLLRRSTDGGKYCVLFDPLDGSSNLNVCVGVGTIFSVLRNNPNISDPEKTILQPGYKQVAAGYILYGSSIIFVLTTGDGVDMFVLDQSIGAFLLVQQKIRMPTASKIYSVNEANRDGFPEGYRKYLEYAHANDYTSRYIGSMVADVHRTLLLGGVFLYPPTTKHPGGKLRLMYEANPMAFIIEQAGGRAISGATRTMDIEPDHLHQRVPVILGSADEMARVMDYVEA